MGRQEFIKYQGFREPLPEVGTSKIIRDHDLGKFRGA
jgi:hypothetical protein